MAALRLTARDREALSEKARHSTDARETRRALALLDLDAGEPVAWVAQRYQIGRSTVYGWAARWRDADRPRLRERGTLSCQRKPSRSHRLRDQDERAKPTTCGSAVSTPT